MFMKFSNFAAAFLKQANTPKGTFQNLKELLRYDAR